MLSARTVAALRQRMAAGETPAYFDGLDLRYAPVQIGSDSSTMLAAESGARVAIEGPAHIFGEPVIPSALHGVGPATVDVPAKRLIEVRHATVIGTNAVLSADGQLFSPDPVDSEDALAETQQRNATNYQGFLLNDDGPPAVLYAGLPNSGHYPLRALYLHNLEPGNYGSFVFRQLPQLILASQHELVFGVYIVPERTPWVLDALTLTGLPERPVLCLREVCGEWFDTICLCTRFDAEGCLSESSVRGFQRLIASAWKSDRGSYPSRLYVSRRLGARSRPTYRLLINDDEIEAWFENRGFTRVWPETLPFSAQLRLFSRATRIAGPSGSGMLNAVFAPSETPVLDLESFTYTVRQHARLYASTSKSYAFAFGVFDEADDRENPVWRNWVMPIARLNEADSWLAQRES